MEPTPDNTSTFINDVVTPRIRGKFALFDTADGGLHIAYRPEGDEEDQHFEIPGHVLKVAKMLSEGKLTNPMEMLRMMRGE